MNVEDFFEELKNKYRHVFFCPIKNEIYLIAEKYLLLDNKKHYYRYADSKLFGKDILCSRTLKWVYLGDLHE